MLLRTWPPEIMAPWQTMLSWASPRRDWSPRLVSLKTNLGGGNCGWLVRIGQSRSIAEAIGRNLGVPVASVGPDEAAAHFGFLGGLVALDNPTSSARTQELLGWKPEHPGLIEDLDAGHYFADPA